MNVIWKYVIPSEPECIILMPKDAEILTVQPQGHEICMWVLVDPSNEKTSRHFAIYGTGHEVDRQVNMYKEHDLRYIATFQVPPYVFHIFERMW